ncbi:hypothetical protein LTR93_005443 [Exophiala xenobiotica]|nr:hypothetical protein LTR93_005443 [Exophiala xenobiotica]
MGETYRGASAVVIWLGPPEQTISGFIAAAANVPVGEDASFANRGQHHADAFIQLLENPYWTRVWIVQEFILAKTLFVQYGSTWLTWDDFLVYFLPDSVARTARPTHKIDPKESSSVTASLTSYIDELIDRRRLWNDPTSDKDATTLMDLVILNKTRKCKDPRDRVYGVLALSRRQTPGSIAITADYAITPVELFFRVMEAHNTVVLKNRSYSRQPLLEALELDESLIFDSLRDCTPPACPKSHTVSWDGPIFIHGSYHGTLYHCHGTLDHYSRPRVLKSTERSVRRWFDKCDPDVPAASIACAKKASQQSNLENLDAIATEAFHWDQDRGFGWLGRGWRDSWTKPRLINEFTKRITEPGYFDLKGITVVQKPSSWDGNFVLALSRQKYASLASKCVEIERDWSNVCLKLRQEAEDTWRTSVRSPNWSQI